VERIARMLNAMTFLSSHFKIRLVFTLNIIEDDSGEPIHKNQLDIYDLKNEHHKTLIYPMKWEN
jgi:hypothetical protein